MDNDERRAEAMMPLSPVEVQEKVRGLIEFMNPLYDFIFVSKDTGQETTLKDDLEHLSLFIKYEVFDKEAHGREMYKLGREIGGNDGSSQA